MTEFECQECGTIWESLSAASGCATIDAAADRAARQQRNGPDHNIVRSEN